MSLCKSSSKSTFVLKSNLQHGLVTNNNFQIIALTCIIRSSAGTQRNKVSQLEKILEKHRQPHLVSPNIIACV